MFSDMILYMKKHKDFTNKLVKIESQFSKVVNNKININGSFFANCELTKRETQKEISFTRVRKNIKYLRINSTKKIKDIHNKNY